MQLKSSLTIILLVLSASIHAQTKAYKHPTLLDVHLFLLNLNSKTIKQNENNLASGIGIHYIKGLNNNLDWSARIDGSFPDSALKNNIENKGKTLLLSSDCLLRARLFSKASFLHPYALLGVGMSGYQNKFNLYLPAGAGIEINYKELYFIISSEYRKSVVNQFNSHFYYSFGIAGIIGKGKKKQASLSSIHPLERYLNYDMDGDGIADTSDACMDQSGLAIFQGCPDSDGDQIIDKEDKCPKVFGYLKYSGCPIPDTDGDGINDEDDLCIAIPGYARYSGCPIPDEDKDGVNDEEDSCRAIVGVIENKGCPLVKKELTDEIKKAARNIFFVSGSYHLKSRSFPVLDKVTDLLIKNPDLKLIIEGHTDINGTEVSNQLLSNKRAKEVSLYLEKKGIPSYRLIAIGYGQSRPVADNKTEQGRSINRRVELILGYH